MNNVETELEKDAYGNLYGAYEPVTVEECSDGYRIKDEDGFTHIAQ